MNDGKDIAALIIDMEKRALERWNNGDPSGFLEIADPDVVYFDPFLEQRLDGIEALTEYYEAIRGKVKVDRNEFINPKVQASNDMAVLTFNLISHVGTTQTGWNCTEVYRNRKGRWRIIQTHWSITQHLK
jgi:ketosteroid isomerase-like protein